MDHLDALKDLAVKQLGTISAMSWKESCHSFNAAGRLLAKADERMLEMARDFQSDAQMDEQRVLQNALAFYQATIAKTMLSRHKDRIAGVRQERMKSKGESKTLAFAAKEQRWVDAKPGHVASIDQQQATVRDVLASMKPHEHSGLISTCTELFKNASAALERSDELGLELKTVMISLHGDEMVDDLMFLLSIAAMELNRVFEERWPTSMPSAD